MQGRIVGSSVAIIMAIILFVVSQQVLTAQTTTTWGALNVTMAYILPTILLLGAAINLFMTFVRGSGN